MKICEVCGGVMEYSELSKTYYCPDCEEAEQANEPMWWADPIGEIDVTEREPR